MKNFKSKLLFLFIAVLSFTSCLDNKFDEIVKANSNGFDFKTTKELNVTIKALNNSNQPIIGVYIEFYTQNPLTETGALIENSSKYLVFKGITNTLGELVSKVNLATTVDSLSVLVNHIGLPNYQQIKVDTTSINLTIGGSVQNAPSKNNILKSAQAGIWWVSDFKQASDFYYYNTWDKSGVPINLVKPNDDISNDFLADVNASLPERIKLTVSHPEYLASEDDGNIVLVEDAEVWATFVHEGAGFVNTLAYYSYTTGKKPATAKDISHATLMFPNASYPGSGGNLYSGNKVQLLYYNSEKNQYSNVFPAGTTVAWQLRANGWDSGKQTIQAGYYNFYSDKSYNLELDIAQKKHNVILKDNSRKLLLIGFEDLRRDQSSDEDFNDAIFYATVSPYTAVKDGIYQTIDSPKDKDNDGVSDANDEYPEDASKAFNNYYPSKGNVGTLAFEDLWPNKGDYDFNDLVIDYNYNQITNAQNKVVEIDAELTVRAIGASYKNGFGIQFNTSPDNIKSITGQKFSEDILKLAANGTELNQNKAVVMVFDNAYKVIPIASGGMFNTIKGSSYQTPGVVNLKIVFNEPISFTTFGTPPYNPFIFINGDRGREIHLPGSATTSLADLKLFGTGNDNSSTVTGKYYMSDKYLPWAINLPVKFDYPAEKEDITKTYLMFNSWVGSLGFNYMDWYSSNAGYRNNELIYSSK